MTAPRASESSQPGDAKPGSTGGERAPLPSYLPILAGLGLLLSLALEWVHYRTYQAPTASSFCAVGETFDCTVVAAAPESVFFGLPWAIWGALGYAAILTAVLTRSVWTIYLSGAAAVVSLLLLAISVFQIGSLCYLCEAVHLTSWVLFGLVWTKRALFRGSLSDYESAATIFSVPVGAALALLLFLPPYWGDFTYKSDPPFATGVTEEGFPWIGSENPSFTFHEFVDYACPHCKLASGRTLKRLAENSDWRVIRRQQPRMQCPAGRDTACRAARLAYCAGKQGKFWRADRWLFAHYNPRKDIDILQMIDDLHLHDKAFKACFSSEEAFAFVHSEYKAAAKAKIIEVPGYLVEGKRYRENEFEALVKNGGK